MGSGAKKLRLEELRELVAEIQFNLRGAMNTEEITATRQRLINSLQFQINKVEAQIRELEKWPDDQPLPKHLAE